MKFIVSANHVAPEYRLDGVVFTDGASPYRVAEHHDGLFYANGGAFGCGRDYTTPEAAIRALLVANGCTNIVIEKPAPHIANLRKRAEALGLSVTKYEKDEASGCTLYVVHKPTSDWQHGELVSLHGVASIIEQCEADASQIPVLAYCVETTHFSAEVEAVDPAIQARVDLENRIIRAVVEDAIAAGCTVSLNDGEDYAIRNSTDADAIMALTHATDEEMVSIHLPNGWNAHVWLVYGNDGYDVISDYSSFAEPFLQRAAKIGWDAESAPDVALRPFHDHPVCAFNQPRHEIWIGLDEASIALHAAAMRDIRCVDNWSGDAAAAILERLTILATGGLLSSL